MLTVDILVKMSSSTSVSSSNSSSSSSAPPSVEVKNERIVDVKFINKHYLVEFINFADCFLLNTYNVVNDVFRVNRLEANKYFIDFKFASNHNKYTMTSLTDLYKRNIPCLQGEINTLIFDIIVYMGNAIIEYNLARESIALPQYDLSGVVPEFGRRESKLNEVNIPKSSLQAFGSPIFLNANVTDSIDRKKTTNNATSFGNSLENSAKRKAPQ